MKPVHFVGYHAGIRGLRPEGRLAYLTYSVGVPVFSLGTWINPPVGDCHPNAAGGYTPPVA